jgi:hypothetical protein
MMSSNGGSWSHSVAELNNTIKAIKFVKGDTITVTVDPALKKVLFLKKGTG